MRVEAASAVSFENFKVDRKKNVDPYLDGASSKSYTREIVGSKAFNLEYLPFNKSEESLKQDIVSYLGEYRFKVPKFNYELFWVNGEDGGKICDSQGKSMEDTAARAIIERERRGDPTHREINELEGLRSLKTQLRQSQNGDKLIWGSPPGPKSEGYGDYGFLFSGTIDGAAIIPSDEGGVVATKLSMSAIRVESPTIDQYNSALSGITGLDLSFDDADNFLCSPKVFQNEVDLDSILKNQFNFEEDPKQIEKFQDIVKKLDPVINRLIYAIRVNASKDIRVSLFNTLENVALAIRDGKFDLGLASHRRNEEYEVGVDEVVEGYGYYAAPKVAGSCGASGGGGRSNSLFGSSAADRVSGAVLGSKETDKYGDLEFDCPTCKGKNVRPRNELLEKCQKCGSNSVSC